MDTTNEPVGGSCGSRSAAIATLDQGAAFLGRSRPSLYLMAERGEIELVKIGGRTMVRWAELDRVVAEAKPWAPNPRRNRISDQSS